MSDQKILIVDYDAKSLESMVDLFSSYKLEIITAVDGQEAYEKYKSEGPNLIVLEAMLPKLHGFDLTQKISKETRGSIPIIIVTGLYKGAQYKNEAIRSFGAADYFSAPGFTQSPRTISALPTAAINRSACLTLSGRSFVREWQIVTVEFFFTRSKATGMPTILDRPRTTASAPSNGAPVCSNK